MNSAYARVISALERVGSRRSGTLWHCPAHDDRTPSLSAKEGEDGRVLLKCFAGCSAEAVVAALGLELSDLFEDPRRGPQGGGSRRGAASGATVQRAGLAVEELAEAKRLPAAFLRELGLTDIFYMSTPAVRIPYLGADGSLQSTRFRLSMTGDRFRWKKGDKPALYGLWKMTDARTKGHVLLVEGESDAQTLWFHGYPAVGVPGAGTWREDWAAELDGIDTVFLVVEPDGGGESLLGRLRSSRLCDAIREVRLSGHKDVSELHVSSLEGFQEALDAALQAAVPLSERNDEERTRTRETAWRVCADLARSPRILDRVVEAVAAAGVAGEERAVQLTYLAVTSRLLERPVSVVVKGPSSGGKSFVVQRVVDFFPASAVYELTAMSERVLAYSEEPLSHRMLLIFEAHGISGEMGSYLLRSLLSENRLRYEVVIKTEDGFETQRIEREGPTGLLLTTTHVQLHPENETRLLSIPVSDTPEQTAAVLAALADESRHQAFDYSEWHALQDWLAASSASVTIPFGPVLARLVPRIPLRLRRDFATLQSLVRAHALLHRASRGQDEEGRVVATTDDYAVVYDLLADLLAEQAESTVPPIVRQTVEAVARLNSAIDGIGVSLASVAAALGIDKSAASRRCTAAARLGYIRNSETMRGRPARLVVGEPLPDDIPILPAPTTLEEALQRCTGLGGPVGPPPGSLEHTVGDELDEVDGQTLSSVDAEVARLRHLASLSDEPKDEDEEAWTCVGMPAMPGHSGPLTTADRCAESAIPVPAERSGGRDSGAFGLRRAASGC